MFYKKYKTIFFTLGILFFLNVLAWIAVYDLRPQGLEVTFFDVGQGDAIFIETPERNQILIDGGPSPVILEKLGREMPFWDRTIDLVILTHPERDHLAGLLEVLKRYQVQNILWTGVVRDTAEYEEWQKMIQEEGANIYIARAGLEINGELFSENSSQRTVLSVLYPFESLEGQKMGDSNNTSIIVRLVFGENSFLFTGDASKSVERRLSREAGQQLDADVLKAGHHGSKTSSAEEFIEAVSPKIAVISAGKDNAYGHPHQETLNTLEKYGIRVLRTDIDSDIKILCDSRFLKPKSKD